jgi:NADH-quinone oxidoreductase subunit G
MATIEIDGKTFEVENGKMIIEVADEAGIHIPRFCYHKKLSVAANCRMCLVEIHNSKKTVPACATPINDGMKVYTKSEAALKSQQVVMEFLLINHPLDCPICDQGGECELQDVSMGFGSDHSDYQETKRSVDDQSLGSLISTEMTRCIHCTRCVRFGEEIAGLREMGAPFRGEDVKIGTYVESSIRSEVSGNIIDLCPVGALTSKPFRYQARSWELTQKSGIAPHDCLGSQIYIHTRRGKVMRVIPKECESINETWLSDRDRFSYTGLYSEHRLAQPMIKQNGKWQTVDWSAALNFTASKLGEILAHDGAEQLAAFASPSATVEELFILQKWLRALKVENMDFRLHQNDFSGDKHSIKQINNTLNYAQIEDASAIILFGSQIHREVPLASTRVRKAFLNGCPVASVNIADLQFPFETAEQIVSSPERFLEHIIAIAATLKLKDASIPAGLTELIKASKPHSVHKNMAKYFLTDKPVIITGALFESHPDFLKIRAVIEFISQHTHLKWIHLTQGANANGAWAVNFVPSKKGLNVQKALKAKLKSYILHGVEPSHDFADPVLAKAAMADAEFVLALSSFKTDDLLNHADVILPIASLGETSGTFVNLDNEWQSFEGCAQPFEQSRPAWKIYRVLANLSHCPGFDYTSSSEILDDAKKHQVKEAQSLDLSFCLPDALQSSDVEMIKVTEMSIYASDMLTRASQPLQDSAAADRAVIKLNSKTAEKFNLKENVTVTQDNNEIRLPLEIDDRIDENVVIIPATGQLWHQLGRSFEKVSLK